MLEAMKSEKNIEKSATPITLADVAISYRRYANVYDLLFGWVLQDGRNKLIASVNKLAPKSILEMGVGTGLLLPNYPKNSTVFGVDISTEMLAKAQQRIARLGLANVVLRQQDCEKLDFADATFDCVVLPYVLSVTPAPRQLVNEALRVCAVGGHVIIVNHFSGSRFWSWIERLVSPLAARIGFRSTFSYDDVLVPGSLNIVRVENANLFGLSKVVVIAANGRTNASQGKSTP